MKYHRRSMRLRGYDYSKPGFYLVTLCSYRRLDIFGEIVNGRMVLNSFGRIVRDEWERNPVIRPEVKLDVYQIMPDHLHAIIQLSGERWGVSQYAANGEIHQFRSPSDNLGAIIRGFKSASTRKINIARGTPGSPVWQQNYWDRILRRYELSGSRKYIRNNPKNYQSK